MMAQMICRVEGRQRIKSLFSFYFTRQSNPPDDALENPYLIQTRSKKKNEKIKKYEQISNALVENVTVWNTEQLVTLMTRKSQSSVSRSRSKKRSNN